MYGDQVNLADALFISAFSICVVFIILFLISTITDIVAFIINGAKRQNKVKEKNSPKVITDAADTKGVDSATVAVIAAAIACMAGNASSKLIVKSIKRIPKRK